MLYDRGGGLRLSVWRIGVYAGFLISSGCHLPSSLGGGAQPGITFTEVPEAGAGGPKRTEKIAGRVTGAKPGQRVILFARSGTWWVQPSFTRPFTDPDPDGAWSTVTHLGSEYAAVLVDSAYIPPRTTDDLPAKGGHVIAVATLEGRKAAGAAAAPPPKTIQFSGYAWDVVQEPTDSGGEMHANSASNVWTDERGWLHLRIAREGDAWTCAELVLSRSLGYGSYSFALRGGPVFEPGTVLGLFTWDPREAAQNHREIDVELSQWGDSAAKNAQFTIQPYYVAANVFRFQSPSSTALTHSFVWQQGQAGFKTVRTDANQSVIAEHVFTSGVPSPGAERVHMNLYIYGKSRMPQRRGVEVVIEKFAFLP